MKPKLLALELWGLGDLALASDFLRAAGEKYSVTLLAKPVAGELREKLWPEVEVVPFVAPWTAFQGKYRFWRWPRAEMRAVRDQLRRERFDIAVSARPDPRDHWTMWRTSARRRVGFARAGGGMLLTEALEPLPRFAHRYDRWRAAASALDLDLPERENLVRPTPPSVSGRVVLHSGAAQSVRVWPLDRCAEILKRIRAMGLVVDLLCDKDQAAEWNRIGEREAKSPTSISELLERLEGAAAFIGNDSGPGHLAAGLGTPTFTIFGPQLPESFAPAHPRAQWVEGEACPHKPCFDACRFAENHCLLGVDVERVWKRMEPFLNESRRAD